MLSMAGFYHKEPLQEEVQGHTWGRRGLVAVKDIKKGSKLTSKNVVALRPLKGLSAKEYLKINGKKAKTDIPKGAYLLKNFIDY